MHDFLFQDEKTFFMDKCIKNILAAAPAGAASLLELTDLMETCGFERVPLQGRQRARV